MSFPTTGQTSYGTVVKAYIDDADTAAIASSADAALAAAWARAPRVDDLTYPIVIAHRGAADLEAQNTVAAFRNAAGLGFQAIEAGDVQALADGTLVCMHDPTVDSTTDGTGNVNTFTAATWAALHVDYETAQGGSYANQPAPTWDDALAALAGKCVVVPEVKDQLDSTATAMCDRLDALGATDSAIIQSFNMTNLAIASGRGYKTMYLAGTAALAFTNLAAARTAGVWSLGLHYSSGDVTAANIAILQTAGFRVFLYTVDHRVDATAANALPADGYFTNESRAFILGDTTNYRKTSTSWHLTGKWETGMPGPGEGPFNGSNRGTITGSPGAYRVTPTTQISLGQICPLANAASSYTLTVNVAVDTIPTNSSQGPGVYFALPDDSLTAGTDIYSSYFFKCRASGTTNLWAIGATGTATALGTTTCVAFQNLTTTSSKSGTITSFAVSALTVALRVGNQFILPNGQIATVAATASIGATSVTINSLVLTSTIASGAVLRPYITMVMTVSPTTVTAARGDDPTISPISAADTTWRGGWVALGIPAGWSSGAVSFHKATVS